MKKISRRSFLAAAAACGAAAALTACGGSSASSAAASSAAPASSAAASAAADGQKFTIGICQLVQHAALDAATQGFEDALTASFGENVTFDFQNAQGDSATCATITNGFVSSGVDLIMANATPALQAAQSATDSIPVLGTSVTEYGVALGLTDFDGTVGGNISGTSDLAPLDQQAEMIVEWMPEAKKVGLLYCSAEANSQYQVDEVQKYLGKRVSPLPSTLSLIPTTCPLSARRLPTRTTHCMCPPITLLLQTPALWTASAARPRSLCSLAKRASAPAAAWLPFPSATTIWATPLVRWQ